MVNLYHQFCRHLVFKKVPISQNLKHADTCEISRIDWRGNGRDPARRSQREVWQVQLKSEATLETVASLVQGPYFLPLPCLDSVQPGLPSVLPASDVEAATKVSSGENRVENTYARTSETETTTDQPRTIDDSNLCHRHLCWNSLVDYISGGCNINSCNIS